MPRLDVTEEELGRLMECLKTKSAGRLDAELQKKLHQAARKRTINLDGYRLMAFQLEACLSVLSGFTENRDNDQDDRDAVDSLAKVLTDALEKQ
jgi:hypothetical protein